MNTIIINTAIGLWPMLEYELDIVKLELDKGNKVIFIYCAGEKKKCGANNPSDGQLFKKRYCLECNSRVQKGLKWLNTKNGILEIVKDVQLLEKQRDSINHVMQCIDGVKNNEKQLMRLVNIDGVDIFQAAKSLLQTNKLESNIDIREYWDDFKEGVSSGLIGYYSSFNHLTRWTPSHLFIYNGRIPRYRPMMRLAEKSSIAFTIYEYPLISHKNYTLTRGGYPHNAIIFSRLLFESYGKSILSDNIKQKDGGDWYKKRFIRDDSSYDSQFSTPMGDAIVDSKLPSNYNNDLYNLVIFISSEDEIVDEVSEKRPFDQLDAIKFIAESFKNINIWIRMHPRLVNIDKKFVNLVNDTCGLYENITVISASSDVDSYQLIKSSDMIVGFGSTTIIESAYMRKTSINIGPSHFEAFNAVKHMYTSDQIYDFLAKNIKGDYSSNYSAENAFYGACAYAWSVINFGVKPKYLEKNTYLGGYMVRDGIKTQISANIYIKIYNRLLDFPGKILSSFSIIINDSRKWKQFKKAPLESVKRKFFGELP